MEGKTNVDRQTVLPKFDYSRKFLIAQESLKSGYVVQQEGLLITSMLGNNNRDGSVFLQINNTSIGVATMYHAVYFDRGSVSMPVTKGDVISITPSNKASVGAWLVPWR